MVLRGRDKGMSLRPVQLRNAAGVKAMTVLEVKKKAVSQF